ncbi:AIF_collapsed_G0053140.mRNA.1.CDS.1 [Saccharomyces cerevisiae]|nr:AIF_collapsed_G0053140.mRNA.1.CDS.1 [Saccharomyces cerevisiae]
MWSVLPPEWAPKPRHINPQEEARNVLGVQCGTLALSGEYFRAKGKIRNVGEWGGLKDCRYCPELGKTECLTNLGANI